MNIRVLFFAGLRDIFGRTETVLPLSAGATLGSLERELLHHRTEGTRSFRSVRWAVNHEMATAETKLFDGDEVALLPPMAGG